MNEKREQFQAQIHELRRFAEEAESCAQLLRQQADKHQEILDSDELTEERLDKLLAERPNTAFEPQNLSTNFRPSEGLM